MIYENILQNSNFKYNDSVIQTRFLKKDDIKKEYGSNILAIDYLLETDQHIICIKENTSYDLQLFIKCIDIILPKMNKKPCIAISLTKSEIGYTEWNKVLTTTLKSIYNLEKNKNESFICLRWKQNESTQIEYLINIHNDHVYMISYILNNLSIYLYEDDGTSYINLRPESIFI